MKTLIRAACETDIDAIIDLFNDDFLGIKREDTSQKIKYITAFDAILQDPNAEIWVVEESKKVVGVAQINYLVHLVYQGGRRAHIEGVHIHKDYRSQGLGKKLFNFLMQRAKEKNCYLIQLTSNKQRTDAIRFYQKLGFVSSHEGFKMELNNHV